VGIEGGGALPADMEVMTGVVVPLSLALLQVELELEPVDMLEQVPMEQQEAELDDEELDEPDDEEELELEEAGLRRLRSLLMGLCTPS